MTSRSTGVPAAVSGPPRSRFVTLGGLPFHYVDWGGDGRVMVLIHGTGFHAYVWKPVAQAFADTHHVLALDQRGHGDSAKPDAGYEWERFAEDLERFLEAVG